MKLMKSILLTIPFALAVSAYSLPKVPMGEPRTVEQVLNISNVFVSDKMDKEDASVVVSGHFPNSCYSWSRATVNENADERSESAHVIRTYANVQQGMCLMVLTPFTKEIELGALSNGEHTVKVMNGDGTYQQLTIDVR